MTDIASLLQSLKTHPARAGLQYVGSKKSAKSPLEENLERNKAYVKEGTHSYNTSLTPEEESVFRNWVVTNGVPFDPDGKTADYDMRGFWKALQTGDERAKSAVDPNDQKIHYPDYWKTPYHETFSNESQWATPAAPAWNAKDQLVAPDGKVLFDDKVPSAKAVAAPDKGAK